MHWTPGTWWNAPPIKRKYAYYLCMRYCYGMPAIEAWEYVKNNYSQVKDIKERIQTQMDYLRKKRNYNDPFYDD